VIEHCDSYVGTHPFEKGFMSVDEEISVLKSFAGNFKVGLAINWARSAIEGRSSSTVVDHIKLARKNKLLSGFFFREFQIRMGATGSGRIPICLLKNPLA